MADRTRFSERAVEDVRSRTLSFSSYRWVLLVTLIVGAYYALLASDRYVTVARVYVKSATEATNVSFTQLAGLPGAGGTDTREALLAQAYLSSRDMLEYLEKAVGFSEHFSSSEWDFYSRLSSNASDEERLDFYRDAISSSIESDTGILTIRGQGYTNEFSLALVQAMVKETERYINRVSQSIALQEIGFVEGELANAQKRMETARDVFLAFQNKNGILSIEAAGKSLQGAISQMENMLIEHRTEEKVLASYLNPEAAELVTVRSKIAALEEQLLIERAKLASQDSTTLNDQAAEYKRLEMDLTFATELYQTALVGLEKARIESYHKLKHLVVVQTPILPDSAILPRKLYSVITLFVALTLIYGISAMILATIREHRDV
ncbi:hypothetical protein KFE96_06935 [Kordiimonas sp. SCSIO 12603]|uniref:hypothetical protein n=1 Tax=Kordiimonas sp. SCSIO 12603 TaxID=2829596 RepID=UPI0021084517|nr:hypothetical protein [Kordiimonas sp. SCSIO 12603]UTW60037.1 hypothetical protein KFE96_06935 [Kordiimonas sp. SCSIO 12603]